MEQILCHLVGDYLLQNDWMATNKTKKHLPAIIHSIVYSLPFLFITSPLQVLFIALAHFPIDRYRVPVLWIKFVNNNWKSTNFGYEEDKPAWMSVWLMIIIDNTFHLLINYLIITGI